MAIRPAAEPRIRLLIIVMLNLQVVQKGRFRICQTRTPEDLVPQVPKLTAQILRAFGNTRITRGTQANYFNGTTEGFPIAGTENACAILRSKILYELR
jgi:hypothetical protein